MPDHPARSFIDALHRALDAVDLETVGAIVELLHDRIRAGSTVFTLGNGGSAATAAHFAVDLSANAGSAAPFTVLCLSDNVPRLTALANDRGYEEVFAHPLRASARPGDLVVVFSGSGRSENVLEALRATAERGAKSIGFLGFGGGEAEALVDAVVTVASDDYAVVESVHNALAHLVAGWVGRRLAGERAGWPVRR